ncbi:methyltransferase [Legionella septentrionalis]|uniref:methyltransferase n=1 Tax=Legionella septentrionalis TaxID=2498109 RepID=UPI000F8D73BA|nr:methyltransferase [Legionella septentrionalis]RUQ97967.1 methyltransferase [Legionella septentrionalis]
MALEEQAFKYRSLDEWFNTPQGARIGLAFAAELNEICEQISGTTLLQLGNCGDNSWLPAFKFRHKWIITPYIDYKKSSIISSVNHLPIERDSIECLIAPLTLEAFRGDKNPLDEMDRIIKPMGYIIFLGINPWSFWGASLKWGHLHCFAHGSISLVSSFTIKRAMLNRGYQQCSHNSFYYVPPVKHHRFIQALEFMNAMGKMIWPFPAGFYCLIMQKYQYCSPDLLIKSEGELVLQGKSSLAT